MTVHKRTPVGRSGGIGPVVWHDGRFVLRASASVSVSDRGPAYGFGAFDTVRLHRGVPIFLDRHLARLGDTIRRLGLELDGDSDVDVWSRRLIELARRNGVKEGLIRIQITGGTVDDSPGSVTAWLRPLPPVPRRGLRLMTAPWRLDPRSPAVGAKTLAFLPYLLAREWAKAWGADAAMLCNLRGRIADGDFFNIFCLLNETLVTPALSEGALPGVTRSWVLEDARRRGLAVREGRVSPAELSRAELVFATSVAHGPVGVVSIDGIAVSRSMGGGRLLAGLRRRWRVAIDGEAGRVGRI